jgi:hypothetical protein
MDEDEEEEAEKAPRGSGKLEAVEAPRGSGKLEAVEEAPPSRIRKTRVDEHFTYREKFEFAEEITVGELTVCIFNLYKMAKFVIGDDFSENPEYQNDTKENVFRCLKRMNYRFQSKTGSSHDTYENVFVDETCKTGVSTLMFQCIRAIVWTLHLQYRLRQNVSFSDMFSFLWGQGWFEKKKSTRVDQAKRKLDEELLIDNKKRKTSDLADADLLVSRNELVSSAIVHELKVEHSFRAPPISPVKFKYNFMDLIHLDEENEMDELQKKIDGTRDPEEKKRLQAELVKIADKKDVLMSKALFLSETLCSVGAFNETNILNEINKNSFDESDEKQRKNMEEAMYAKMKELVDLFVKEVLGGKSLRGYDALLWLCKKRAKRMIKAIVKNMRRFRKAIATFSSNSNDDTEKMKE